MAKYTANVVKATCRYTDGANVYENVYDIDNGSPASLIDLVALSAVLRDWETNHASAARHTSISLFEIELVAQDSDTAPRLTDNTGLPIDGTLAGVILPTFVTAAIRLEGSTARKYSTGRTYWIGLTQADYSTNQLNPTTRNTLVAILASLGTLLIAAGKFLIVLSKVIGKVGRPTNLISHVASTSADLILDSMNSRKDGHGI